ncbi:hypothetical protein B0O79_2908 [Flavobacteriaceae bacterium MAR_2009_75]|nr:hypothetical protein B0O79_2908 [Flavobacteriaceae bacterium MAR_2009_75]
MLKLIPLLICIFVLLSSCKDNKSEQDLPLEEVKLIDKQKQLEVENELLIEHDNVIHLDPEMGSQLVICENENFTIMVIQSNDKNLKYMSWNQPKLSSEQPDLILLDGKIEEKGSYRYNYIFTHGPFTYIIENKLIGEYKKETGIFLRILKNGKEELYSKMTDLKIY